MHLHIKCFKTYKNRGQSSATGSWSGYSVLYGVRDYCGLLRRSPCVPTLQLRTHVFYFTLWQIMDVSPHNMLQNIQKQRTIQCHAPMRCVVDNCFYEARSCSNRVYQVLSPIIGSKRATSTVPNVTPDAINSYFVNVGPTTVASVIAPSNPPPIRLPRVPSCAFRVGPISDDDLCITLGNMKKSSSVDSTGFSMALFQKFFFGLRHVLRDIINSSLITGIVPDAWKHGIVVPLPKGGTTTDPANWRPVTTLPAISKIVERIVHNQLSSYFTDACLLSSAQHGYRRNHSTETALTVVTDSIYKAMDEGKISILVLLDCSKCFDVISHSKLLDKLLLYGVENHWFTDYLQNHRQQVKITTKDGIKLMSRLLPNRTGVYQGGSLSCLLFSVFTNELNLYTDRTKVVCYADDTQIWISGHKRNISDMVTSLESELSLLFDWFAKNSLKLNSAKTQVIVFGTKAMLWDLPTVSVRVGDTVVSECREVKNLGVHMDRHLTYGDHIDHLVRKCTGTLLCLVHASRVIPHYVFKQIVVALVLSSIRYCMSIYGTCGVTQLHRVQKLINFSARVISRKRKYERISQEIRRLGFLTAAQLVSYHQLCLVRRILVTGEPQELSALFSSSEHEHDTRNAHRLVTTRARTNAGERRISNVGVRKLNNLSSEVRGARPWPVLGEHWLLRYAMHDACRLSAFLVCFNVFLPSSIPSHHSYLFIVTWHMKSLVCVEDAV